MSQIFLNPEVVCEIDSIVYYQYPHLEQYLISKCGKVYNTASEKLLKSSQTTDSHDGSRSYYHVHLSQENGKYKRAKLHRMLAETFIANPENKPLVDHRNQNILDNTLSNLRWVTDYENMQNRKLSVNNTSGYIGVGKEGNRYRATIRIKGKNKRLGRYDTPELAALAYNEAAAEAGYLHYNKLD